MTSVKCFDLIQEVIQTANTNKHKEEANSVKQDGLGMKIVVISSQFSSFAQSCPTLCDPMNCSTPGLRVHHQLPESTQTHVH